MGMFFFRRDRGASLVEGVSPHWVRERMGEIRIIDVREPHEFTGPLGHIEGAELVPLATLARASRDWSKDTPLVLVCRSGARSGRAAIWLKGQGFERPLNLEGGMLAWHRSLEGSEP